MPSFRIFANKYSPRSNASSYSKHPASPSSKPLLTPQPSPPSSSATSSSSSPLATPPSPRAAYRHLSLPDIHLLTRILSPSASCSPDDLRMADKNSSRDSTPKRDTAGGAKMASSEGSDDDGDDGGDKGRTPPVSAQLPPSSSLSPTTNETIGRIRTRLRIAELPSHLRQCMSPATAATAVTAVRTTATTTPTRVFRDRNHGRRRHCRRRRTGIAHRPGCGGHAVRTTSLSSPAYSEQADEEDGAEEERDVGGELCTFHTGLDGVLLRSVLTFVWREAGSWASGLGLIVVGDDEDEEGAGDDNVRVKEVLALLGRAKGELVSWFEDERRTKGGEVRTEIGSTLQGTSSQLSTPLSSSFLSPPTSTSYPPWSAAPGCGAAGFSPFSASPWTSSPAPTTPSSPGITSSSHLRNACPACVLTRVGSAPALILALRVSLLAWCRWERLAKGSKRLAWVDGWLWWACMREAAADLGGGDVETAARALFDERVRESEEMGRILKQKLRWLKSECRKNERKEEKWEGGETTLPSPSSVYSQEVSLLPA